MSAITLAVQHLAMRDESPSSGSSFMMCYLSLYRGRQNAGTVDARMA